MTVFFQFIAGIALFFGIASFVFATEVSKRCQELIDARFDEIENLVAKRLMAQDKSIADAMHTTRIMISNFEDAQFAQTREINALRKALEFLTESFEKKIEEEKKREAFLAARRR